MNNSKGMSLLEIMIAVVISSSLGLIAFSLLSVSLKQAEVTKGETALNDEFVRLGKFLDNYIGNAIAVLCPVPSGSGGSSAAIINCQNINQDYFRTSATGYCKGDTVKVAEVITEESITPNNSICLSNPTVPDIYTNNCKKRIGIYFTAPLSSASAADGISRAGKIYLRDEITNNIFYDWDVTKSKMGITKFSVAWTTGGEGAGVSSNVSRGALSFRIEGKAITDQAQSFCPYTDSVGSAIDQNYTNGVIRSLNLNVSLRNLYIRGVHFGKITEQNK